MMSVSRLSYRLRLSCCPFSSTSARRTNPRQSVPARLPVELGLDWVCPVGVGEQVEFPVAVATLVAHQAVVVLVVLAGRVEPAAQVGLAGSQVEPAVRVGLAASEALEVLEQSDSVYWGSSHQY
jgi:hypothetical protein